MDHSKESGMNRRRALKVMGITAAVATMPGVVSSGLEKMIMRFLAIEDPLSRKSLSNALRMGHCAPTILQTLLEADKLEDESLIHLSAGLPGGIGNQGGECGGVTAAVMHIGVLFGGSGDQDLWKIRKIGGHYLTRFQEMHGSLDCRDIQNPLKGIRPCIRAICTSPGLLKKTIHDTLQLNPEGDAAGGSPDQDLVGEWQKQNFHCARSVFQGLDGFITFDQNMYKAALGFLGGTLLKGKTCSALTAGVMAIGARIREVENSRFRVLKMAYKMMTGGDAMNDKINRFNKSINAGKRLADWFRTEYGSIHCQEITRSDFSTAAGVQSYISGDRISFCKKLVATVSEQVKKTCQDLTFHSEGNILLRRCGRPN